MDSLEHLMGAYFHQDWDLDGGTVHDTVDAFAAGSPARVEPAMSDIDQVLELDLREGQLRSLLQSMGCEYFAGDTDDDYRNWLADIRARLQADAPTV